MTMHALFVYAHPEPTSFTAALKDTGAAALREAGHTVQVSDLYAENFNPVAGRHDFSSVADMARFHYQTEQGHAHKHEAFAPDLVREQQRFMKADLIVWLFPIWWGGMPAIMKGWFDRVLAFGFAYADGRRFDSGFFPDKRGLLCLSTGGTQQRFSDEGVYGARERRQSVLIRLPVPRRHLSPGVDRRLRGHDGPGDRAVSGDGGRQHRSRQHFGGKHLG